MRQKDLLSFKKENGLSSGEVYPLLRRAIVELYLRPGTILSIKDICMHFNIGRSPTRDALIRMEQEGLVTFLPQRGTMISKIDPLRVEEERFLRYAVEKDVMKSFIACYTPADINQLIKSLRKQQELCSKKNIDIREFLVLDDEFHGIFYKATDKLFCFNTIKNVSGHYRRVRLLSFDDISIDKILGQHAALIAAIQENDTQLMCNIFKNHLTKLNDEEKLLIEQFPYLFKGPNDIELKNQLLEDDFLKEIKQK